MNHLSLFSGIGGFDLAAQWMGWNNVAHCEFNEFCKKVLQYYWPEAISYHDITTTDFTVHRGTVDIITGGFPCQPYSVAGKRKGTDDERHLWPEMLRAIREVQPTYVVGENVPGLVNWNGGLVFEQVQADLEAEGYEVTPFILPAASVNAPHKRERIWFVAYASCFHRRSEPQHIGGERKGARHKSDGCAAQNTDMHERYNQQRKSQPSKRKQWNIGAGDYVGVCPYNGEVRFTANPRCWTGDRREKELCGSINNGQNKGWEEAANINQRLHSSGFDTDTHGKRLWGQGNRPGNPRQFNKNSTANDWSNFPTQSPLCSGNDEFSSQLDGITFSKWRNESIKAGGNAIVPAVAYQIFQTIEQFNQSLTYETLL